MPDKKKLTPKQAEFVRHYLICRNATEAARKAGYSRKTAQEQGSRLLSNVMVQEAIGRNETRLQEKFEITQDAIIQELAAVGFGHAGRVMSWTEGRLYLIPKDEMSETDMKYIETITETQTEHGGSIAVKTLANQKVKALELLGKHVGMFNGQNKPNTGDRKAILERLSKHLRKRSSDGGGGSSS